MCTCLLEHQALSRSLTEANTAIMALEQTGEFRFEGLTLNQWAEVRAQRTAEIGQSVEAHRKHTH